MTGLNITNYIEIIEFNYCQIINQSPPQHPHYHKHLDLTTQNSPQTTPNNNHNHNNHPKSQHLTSPPKYSLLNKTIPPHLNHKPYPHSNPIFLIDLQITTAHSSVPSIHHHLKPLYFLPAPPQTTPHLQPNHPISNQTTPSSTQPPYLQPNHPHLQPKHPIFNLTTPSPPIKRTPHFSSTTSTRYLSYSVSHQTLSPPQPNSPILSIPPTIWP